MKKKGKEEPHSPRDQVRCRKHFSISYCLNIEKSHDKKDMSRKKNMLRHEDDEDELVIETDAEKT